MCHGNRVLVIWYAWHFRSLYQSSVPSDCSLPPAHCPDLHYDFCVLGSFDGFWEIHQDLLYMPIEDDKDYIWSQTKVILMRSKHEDRHVTAELQLIIWFLTLKTRRVHSGANSLQKVSFAPKYYYSRCPVSQLRSSKFFSRGRRWNSHFTQLKAVEIDLRHTDYHFGNSTTNILV